MAEHETTVESELIRRAQAGEQQAFQQIARQHSEPLLCCALTLCRDRQLAEDIAQETLLEAWRSIGRFDGERRFSTWLYGILRHRFLKARRRVSRRIVVDTPTDDLSSMSQTATDPSRESQREEDAERIRSAVSDLPDEHRQVIELRFFADAKLDDIAVTLGIPLGTVKSRLHNGLDKLRQANLALNLFPASGESSARHT
jgi:RNA polymerase sigma-70 factor, ECF subfamily